MVSNNANIHKNGIIITLKTFYASNDKNYDPKLIIMLSLLSSEWFINN